MKKSTIWMLATVMGFAFAGLFYLQVSYISIIMKTSNEQFDTTVRRCLEKVSGSIERDEVYRYLEEDIKSGGNSFMYKSPPNQMEINQKITQSESYQLHVQNANNNIQQGRDRKRQAVLPLRGKILNIEKASILPSFEADVKCCR